MIKGILAEEKRTVGGTTSAQHVVTDSDHTTEKVGKVVVEKVKTNRVEVVGGAGMRSKEMISQSLDQLSRQIFELNPQLDKITDIRNLASLIPSPPPFTVSIANTRGAGGEVLGLKHEDIYPSVPSSSSPINFLRRNASEVYKVTNNIDESFLLIPRSTSNHLNKPAYSRTDSGSSNYGVESLYPFHLNGKVEKNSR